MFARLVRYLDSIKARDPAPRSRAEILTYPGVWAVALHKVAHRLFKARWYFAARCVNHLARFMTAIDIHPGATIGQHFFIDHGFVVIGETAEIGDGVTIYQNVTLGGTSPDNGIAGKRHPTISDGAIIGSGAQVLGPITIGRRARVGANAVVTKDVPEGTTVVGIPARPTVVEGGQAGDPRFVPYGTPCRDMFDPQTQRIELLRCELETLRRRLDEVLAEQQDQRDRA